MNAKANYKRKLREDVEREAANAVAIIVSECVAVGKDAQEISHRQDRIASRVADYMLKRFRMIRR
jgi:pyruvate formate-lyase activating enzyme-like uncharacterized protein